MRKAPRITQTKHIVTLLQELQYKGQFNINTILNWLLLKYEEKDSMFKIVSNIIRETIDICELDFNNKLEYAINLAQNLVANAYMTKIVNMTVNKGYIKVI